MHNYRTNTTTCGACRPMPMPMPTVSPRCDAMGCNPLAMAYVSWQEWRDIYEAEKGFRSGTIFQELNLPFLGKGGSRR